MNYQNVKEIVFTIISDKLGVDMYDFNENSSYSNDLGADSLDAVELMLEFESYFGIIVKDEEFQIFTRNSTIKQSIDFITSKLNIPILNEQKMKIKCIDQNNYKDITVGNEYEVSEILENFYHITADSGNIRSYNKKYFEVISEPIIEDVDEVGVVEEENSGFTVGFDDDSCNIEIHIDEVMAMLYYYPVASNCGVHSYHGINNLFEQCNKDKELLKEIINEVIELIKWEKNCCMFILSTNEEYEGIWTVLDEIMDTESNVVKNPNSNADVKLWIKYIY